PAPHLGRLLADHRVDLVVLAGYLTRLEIPPAYRGRIVNIHPALLPAHGGHGMYGRRVHEAVLAAGDTESGCTVHLVDDEYDRGPIIAQTRVPVLKGDIPETLAARVFEAECATYPAALAKLLRTLDNEPSAQAENASPH
ncbi:MAG: formyltransferase family protein, partial [Phycisphaerales bacterium]